VTSESVIEGLRIGITEPSLWEITFKRLDESVVSANARVQYQLELFSNNTHHLGVQLRVVISGIPWAEEVSAVCRTAFVVRTRIEDDQARKLTLHALGTVIGPKLLYPFLREALLSVSQKSGAKPIVLPLATLEELSDIELPNVTEEPPPEWFLPAEEVPKPNAPKTKTRRKREKKR